MLLALTLALSTLPSFAAVEDTGYSDVDAGADYAPAVVWCAEQGLMNGVGGDAFSPDATLDRSMVATILYRAAGEPAVSGDPAFNDTKPGQWYSNAVVWAGQNGIFEGYGDGRFGTNDPITQEQLTVLILRYQGENPVWTGDPALAVPATRAEAAVAFYNGLKEDDEPATPSQGKTLVAYFSATNNTEGVAQRIADILSADLYEITPEVAYTSADLNYNTDCRANQEQNDASARPAISGSVENMADYDVIFLGYPIWWGQAPKIIYTFVESYDLSGKTIVPFCTSGSSPIGSSAANVQPSAAGAIWLSGQRFSAGASRETLSAWIDGLSFPAAAQ